MKRFILLAAILSVCAGCASIPRTTTYQVQQWEEVVETPPPKTQIVQPDLPREFPKAVKGRKYSVFGIDPVHANYVADPAKGEIGGLVLIKDEYIQTVGHNSTKPYWTWARAGEPVIAIATQNPDYLKVIRICRCGNPVLNTEPILLWVKHEEIKQQPVKSYRLVNKEVTRELTCHERKQMVPWYGKLARYAVTIPISVGGALIGGKVGGSAGIKAGAAIGATTGRIVGSLADGTGCIDDGEITEAIVLGAAAYMIAPTNAHGTAVAGSGTTGTTGGPSTLPPNGPTGPAVLPVNGPVTGAPSVLPVNGPRFLPGS